MSLTKSRTNTKTATQLNGSVALTRFHRYWQDLEKLQVKQAKKDAENAALYQRFQTDIEPLEKEQCQLIFQLTERLIGFTARKSLTHWQRDMLHEWIHEDIEYLENNPFRGEMELDSLYSQIQSNVASHLDEDMLEQQCDFITQMLMETCSHCPEDIGTLREMVKIPDKLRDYLMNAAQQEIAEEVDSAEENDDAPFDDDELADLFGDEEPFNQGQQDPYARARTSRENEERTRFEVLFNKSTLKQLYRKLALALHPDREQDLTKREEKTHIMGQLSHAWEHKEMFTLLQLAHTHLPESANLLSDDNLAIINPLLRHRLINLEAAYFINRPDGMLGIVVQRFKQRSKKLTEAALADHHAYLVQDIAQLTKCLADITSLQTLKPYLAARWDEKEQQEQQVWDKDPDVDWMFR